jgi:hypothetical protein
MGGSGYGEQKMGSAFPAAVNHSASGGVCLRLRAVPCDDDPEISKGTERTGRFARF